MTRLPLVPALLVSTLVGAVACGSPPEPAPPEVTPATTINKPGASPPVVAPAPPPPVASTPAPAPTKPVQPDLALLDHTGDVCQGAAPPPPPSSATAAKVTVKQGEVKVTGSVNHDVTSALLAAGKDQFAACYAAGIDAKSPGTKAASGKIGGVFVFGMDGKVALSRLEAGATTVDDKEVASCVVRAICSMTFQPPTAGIVTVAHSMTLSR